MTRARELAKLGNPNVITVDSSNNVGIGSTTPDAKLDVGGAFIVGSGASITEDGEAVFAGVCTAVGLNVTGSDVSGVGTQGLNIEATGAVVSGVSTFYGDTNVGTGITLYPSTGIVSCAQVTVRTGGLSVDGQADLDEVVVAGASTFSGGVVVTTTYPSVDADNEVQVGTTIQLGQAGIVTAVGLNIATGGVDIDGQTDLDELQVAGVATFSAAIDAYSIDLDGQADLDEVVIAGVTTASNNVNVSGGTITVGTGITIAAVAGFGTFSKGVKLGKGGLLVEGISSVSAGFDNTSDLNLDDGMVHYTNDALAGNANTLNLTSSVGINTAMALNEMIIVTGITSVSSTSHYVNALTIDNVKARNICWIGGAAPTEGGSAGFDVYTFNVWKTGDKMFNVIANHVTCTA